VPLALRPVRDPLAPEPLLEDRNESGAAAGHADRILHPVVEEITHAHRSRSRLDAGARGHEVAERGRGSVRRHLHRRHVPEAADNASDHASRDAAFHAARNPAFDADV